MWHIVLCLPRKLYCGAEKIIRSQETLILVQNDLELIR